MIPAPSPLALSLADRERIAQIDSLARAGRGTAPALIGKLSDRSWAVRRAVVAALARLGDEAIGPLVSVLLGHRDDEGALAAAVDALSASRGDADQAMLELIGGQAAVPLLCDAAQVLGRRRSAAGVPALQKLTAHSDDNVAMAAIEALGRIGGGAGLEALSAVVRGGNFFRIFPAMDVLGRSGDPRALQPLLELLDNRRYALEAARALGRTGEPAAAAPLVAALRKANDSMARVVAVAMCALHARALTLFGTAAPVTGALRDGDDPVPLVQRLAQSVSGATAEEQDAVCAVLAWISDDAAAASLISLLDVTPAAASTALRALGRESDSHLLTALREGDSTRRALLLPLIGSRTRSAADIFPCLEDEDPAVRVLACNALARIGDATAVPRLFEILRDPDPMLSQAAVGALQSLGSAATEKLALAAARSDEPNVRRAALRIVAAFGYPAALDLLIEVVQGGDDRLRDVAIQGLALMDDRRALSVLLETCTHANPRARAAAMRALGQATAGQQVVGALLRGLSDADAWVRYYACQSLGKLGVSSAVGFILGLVRDPAGQVRVAAVEALSHLDARAAVEALHLAAQSPDPDVQRAALLGLGARAAPEALPALLQAAASRDSAMRLIALSAVAPYRAPEALQALIVAASDPDVSLRDAAIGYLTHREEEAASRALIALAQNPLVRDRALDALAVPVGSRILSLANALESAGPELATTLVAALARTRRADGLAAIIDALGMSNLHARRAAATALSALKAPEARPALDRAAKSDPDPEVRRAALSGLVA